MPVTYAYDDRIVVMDLCGEYTTADLRKGILRALDDARCPPRPVLLFDMRDSTAIRQRTMDEVRTMAQFLAAHGARFSHRLAVVTGSDVAFGLMRVGAVEAEWGGVEPMVFRDLAEARAWLLR